MDVVRTDVEKLVLKELQSANDKFGMFNSLHEGYAVILEEFDESKDNLNALEMDLNYLWYCIKNDIVDEDFYKILRIIKTKAVSFAVEAIQVAAMAQKFVDSKLEV